MKYNNLFEIRHSVNMGNSDWSQKIPLEKVVKT